MARQQVHPYDEVADDVLGWLQTMERELTDGMLHRGRAPGEAPISEQQKAAFFRRRWWKPDGTPNEEGRAALMQQYGPDGYVRIAQAVGQEPKPGLREMVGEEVMPDA